MHRSCAEGCVNLHALEVERVNRFSSRQFRSSPTITSALLSLMDLGGVRRKMTRKNCERINAVKTVNGKSFKNSGTP